MSELVFCIGVMCTLEKCTHYMHQYIQDPPLHTSAAGNLPLTFPVPGGPYNNKCGKLSLSINLVNMLTISSCATRSSSLAGRYFSTHGICMLSSGMEGRLLTLMVGLSSVSIFAASVMVVVVASLLVVW